MIRRVLVCIFLLYLIIWYLFAYFIKNNLNIILKSIETDNIKISYSDFKFEGFPKKINFVLINPKITIIENNKYKELMIPKLLLLVDFSFKKLKLTIFDHLELIESFGKEKSIKFIKSNDKNIEIILKLNVPVYSLLKNFNDFYYKIKFFQFNNKGLIFLVDNKNIFNIENISFLVLKNFQRNAFFIKSTFLYYGNERLLNFRKAFVDTAIILRPSNSDEKFFGDIEIKYFKILCDDLAHLYLNGSLDFRVKDFPEGKINIEFGNYKMLVEKLIPRHWIFFKNTFQNLFKKALALKEIGNFSDNNFVLEISLSNKGIFLDKINLFELDFNKSLLLKKENIDYMNLQNIEQEI